MDLPTIETERLLLREASTSDIDDLYALYSNPNVVRYTGDSIWTEKQDAIEFLKETQEGLKEESLFGWCVELKETKR